METYLDEYPPGVAFSCGRKFSPANRWRMEDGKAYVVIDGLEAMDPFFLNIVGSGDHWFFCGSNGAPSAGRRSPETALFPYYTVDKILDNWNSTGPWTAVVTEGKMWNPFRPSIALLTPARRCLMKSEAGDEVVFEETREDLGLRFTYRWQLSEKFGFVRRARLENVGGSTRSMRLVDGLDNLMPDGVDCRTQLQYSCLTDAYKISELEAGGRLLVHRLAAGITDQPIPLENLRATTVWTNGFGECRTYLTRHDAEEFLRGNDLAAPDVVRARRGGMFLAREISLEPGGILEWMMVAEIGQTQAEVGELARKLQDPGNLEAEVAADVLHGRERLVQLVAAADGIQHTADRDAALYHYHNTLSNIMRGGVPADGYTFRRSQFSKYLESNNRALSERYANLLQALPATFRREELLEKARLSGDTDLMRLAVEYLPLMLSRRHGDPSRPWNRFVINLRDDNGEPVLHFEGNWRDIFQNWEALAWSYPDFLEAFITKFLNASTVDGFNPYRITSDGVDWEEPDEEDPWSSIGYWGDHQIIYLLKFLELQAHARPEKLEAHLDDQTYVFADVPYRLRAFGRTLEDARDTVEFDAGRHAKLMAQKERLGGDGLLLRGEDGETLRVTLLEKLLLPAAVKLANLVPGGGVWMNTQRPEWNDANNALAGCGLSVVTAAYLYRYLGFLEDLLDGAETDRFRISPELGELVETLADLLGDARWHRAEPLGGADRFELVEQAGRAAEHHRTQVYQTGPGNPVPMERRAILSFVRNARCALERTLGQNLRPDGLYHSYNVLEINLQARTMELGRLPVMLEGQVAILSAGILEPADALDLLESLPASPLLSERHQSYLLYPDRQLPRFLEGNQVSGPRISGIETLVRMAGRGDERILVADPACGFRFHQELPNGYALAKKLDELAADPYLGGMPETDRTAIEELYESVFSHRSFTGRSGSMFGYEGLGCIYWHMVSKLMLAAQEVTLNAAASGEPHDVVQRLVSCYFSIQGGLGFRKPPADYGAFPSEAYSHSPSHAGAQQPGLTGQVKEGILCRFGELGVRFENGCLGFRPRLLRDAEFAEPSGTISFTLARIPVSYKRSMNLDDAIATVIFDDGSELKLTGAVLDAGLSGEIIRHTGRVSRIEVGVPAAWLLS